MFTYCGNNPVCRADSTGTFWLVVVAVVEIVVITVCCTSSQNQSPQKKQEAKNKYNSSNVAVYERGNTPVFNGDVNAEIYYDDENDPNIHIDESLSIDSLYEQDAVLDVIVESSYYDEDVYGTKDFMQAQWIAHNICYDIASSGDAGFYIMQVLSGSDNPIESSSALDLRSKNNLSRRSKVIYTIISWFC